MYEILVAGIGQIVLLTSARGLRCLRPPATATLLSVGGEGELRTPKSRDALATLQGRLQPRVSGPGWTRSLRLLHTL